MDEMHLWVNKTTFSKKLYLFLCMKPITMLLSKYSLIMIMIILKSASSAH